MNPFLLPHDEYISSWRSLRNSLPNLNEHDQLKTVAAFWAQAPIKKFSYDPEHPDQWPSPWEMIYINDWDHDSIAVGMETTLRLAGWSAERMALQYIRDPVESIMGTVLRVDNLWLLNYAEREVCEVPQHQIIIMYSWRFDGKKYRETPST